MMKYFVHDFLFEETNINNNKACFFYQVSVYCTHNKQWKEDQSEKLLVSVGNPTGIAQHLEILKNVFIKRNEMSFFSGPFMVVDNYDEDKIMRLLKEKIESITGINKRELLYNLTPFFEWEYFTDEYVVKKFFE